MPIGKNAIQRVVNNGYSNVKTSAPDMENSVVEEKKPKAAKNPVPRAATTGKKSAGGKTKNPVPKGAISMEGVQRVTVKKSTPKKKVENKVEKIEEKNVLVKAEEIKVAEISLVVEEAIEKVSDNDAAEEKNEAPLGSLEKEPELAPVKTLEKITESGEREGIGYTNLGGNLPYYLL